jgi:hypothetical protein
VSDVTCAQLANSFSAITITGKFALPRGTQGMIEASATRRPLAREG